VVDMTRNLDDEAVTDTPSAHEPITELYRGQFDGSGPRRILDSVMSDRAGQALPEPDIGDPTYLDTAVGYWKLDGLPTDRFLAGVSGRFLMSTSASNYARNVFSPIIAVNSEAASLTLSVNRSAIANPWTFFVNDVDTGVTCPQNTEFTVTVTIDGGSAHVVVNDDSTDILDETTAYAGDPNALVVTTASVRSRNFSPGGGSPATGYWYFSFSEMTGTLKPWILPTPLDQATVGIPYDVNFPVDGDAGDLTLGSGSLPPGLDLTPFQTIAGTPTTSGSYPFTLVFTEGISGQTTERAFTIEVTMSLPVPAPKTGYKVGLNGSVMDGGGYDGDPDAFLTVPPDGLGMPDLRTSDQSYPQRDGVDHFSDWYGPRILTFTGVVGESCVCGDARAHASALVKAWQRTCDDTELVLRTPCDTGEEVNLFTNPSFDVDTTDWVGLTDNTLTRDTGVYRSAPGSGKVTATAGSVNLGLGLGPTLDVLPSHTYRFRGYSRAASTTRDIFFFVAWEDVDGNPYFTQGEMVENSSSEWTFHEYTAAAATNAARITGVTLAVDGTVPNAEAHYFDDLSLVDVSGDSINGPFGVRGRPRVAALSWRRGKHQIADVTTRFDAIDHRLYILDAAGNPGSGTLCETVDIGNNGSNFYNSAVASVAQHHWPLDFTHLGADPDSETGQRNHVQDIIGSSDLVLWSGAFNPEGVPAATAPAILHSLGLSSIAPTATAQPIFSMPTSYTSGMVGWWQMVPADSDAAIGTSIQIGSNAAGVTGGTVFEPMIHWPGQNVAMNAEVSDAFGFTDGLRGQAVFIMLAWTASQLRIYVGYEGKSTPLLAQTVSGLTGITGAGNAIALKALGARVSNLMAGANSYGNFTTNENSAQSIWSTAFDHADDGVLTVPNVGDLCGPFQMSFDGLGAQVPVYVIREDGSYVGMSADQNFGPSSINTEDGSGTNFQGLRDATDLVIGDPFLEVSPGEQVYIASPDGAATATLCFRPSVLST
jgi:hypothetical protein